MVENISQFLSNLAIPAEANRWTPQAQPKDSLRVSSLHDSATEVSMTKFIDDFVSFSKHIVQDLTIKASKGKKQPQTSGIAKEESNAARESHQKWTRRSYCTQAIPYQSSGLERGKDR